MALCISVLLCTQCINILVEALVLPIIDMAFMIYIHIFVYLSINEKLKIVSIMRKQVYLMDFI